MNSPAQPLRTESLFHLFKGLGININSNNICKLINFCFVFFGFSYFILFWIFARRTEFFSFHFHFGLLILADQFIFAMGFSSGFWRFCYRNRTFSNFLKFFSLVLFFLFFVVHFHNPIFVRKLLLIIFPTFFVDVLNTIVILAVRKEDFIVFSYFFLTDVQFVKDILTRIWLIFYHCFNFANKRLQS